MSFLSSLPPVDQVRLLEKLDFIEHLHHEKKYSSTSTPKLQTLVDNYDRNLRRRYNEGEFALEWKIPFSESKFATPFKLKNRERLFINKRLDGMNLPFTSCSNDATRDDTRVSVYLIGQCPLHKREHKKNRPALFFFKNGDIVLFCNNLRKKIK